MKIRHVFFCMIIGVLALFGVSYSLAMPYIQNEAKKQNDTIDIKKID